MKKGDLCGDGIVMFVWLGCVSRNCWSAMGRSREGEMDIKGFECLSKSEVETESMYISRGWK